MFSPWARDPIACLNALSFGAPEHPKTRHLVSGVVAGVGGYGNSFGVPTVGGQMRFHTRYDGNNLVNAMAVGLADTDKIFYAAASGVNMPIVYLGSKTGRDGIHGASMASAEFDDDSSEKRPTVQVGDPFAEKLLLEACLEIMEADCVIAIQDMGAAGLTCSAVEMGAKGDLGVDLDSRQSVPTRETGMTAYEMMLSESQERMLMVLKPEKEKEAEAIFRKWGLDFAVVGYTTPSLRFRGEAWRQDGWPICRSRNWATKRRSMIVRMWNRNRCCRSFSCARDQADYRVLPLPSSQADRDARSFARSAGSGNSTIIFILGNTRAAPRWRRRCRARAGRPQGVWR